MSNDYVGYEPANVFDALGAETPYRALFTTFTFSPGAFQQHYLTPLLNYGCPDVAVLVDPLGYAQSLFGAAALQSVGRDYRLRQVSANGAFHGKLVLVRTPRSMVVGVGSGNLTTSGLQTNAEVGALYQVDQPEQLAQCDKLMFRLRSMGQLEESKPAPVGPISLTTDARLLTSLDAPIFDNLELPSDVHQIEIVSPFIDGEQEVLVRMRERWPKARIRVRVDPEFGALTDSLLAMVGMHLDVMVPVEPKDEDEATRPAVHGKLLCFLGNTMATLIVGSANLSRPAFLTTENFEAVVERRVPSDLVDKLLSVPKIRWRKARTHDKQSFAVQQAASPTGTVIATLTLSQLSVVWTTITTPRGVARIWCRGVCILERTFVAEPVATHRACIVIELEPDVREAVWNASAFVELSLDDGRKLRGWVEVSDMLGIAPERKRQLVVLESILSDPQACEEDDVVKFIELLQRNLQSELRQQAYGKGGRWKRAAIEEYDETLVERSQLIEVNNAPDFSDASLLTRLINRSLDAAIHDLRFFGRDRGNDRVTTPASAGSSRQSAPDVSQTDQGDGLPPLIGEVVTALFDQLVDALNAAHSPREVSILISQIPTCLKALSFAVERWSDHFHRDACLDRYFYKVVAACLAPGLASILCHAGAIRRLTDTERESIHGGPELSLGLAVLESYLLIDIQVSSTVRGFIKDMHDVLSLVLRATLTELAAAGAELWRLRGGQASHQPDFALLRSRMSEGTGELAKLREARSMLINTVRLINQGTRDPDTIRPLIHEATDSGPCTDFVLEAISGSGCAVELLEIGSDEGSCPKCFTALPEAARTRLKNSRFVHRCGSCGRFLVRSLDK